ncbi:MAG: HxlR family transcriptional regulator [Micrococcaceae bacterium]|nr:HxlR family transcriptional regulator [Micrococcaceae bacterium]
MVLRELFFGNGRYEAMKERLGAADNVLSKRLASLQDEGLIARRPYDDGNRRRQEYVLTLKGEDTLPVLNAVILWADKHIAGTGPETQLVVINTECGNPTRTADTCTVCGGRLTAATTSWHSPSRTAAPVLLAGAA